MTKLIQGPHKLGYFDAKFLFLVCIPKAKMTNEKNWNTSHNLNFGGIHKHNQKKTMPQKPQIITYCPSMIDINNSIFIDYHKILSY